MAAPGLRQALAESPGFVDAAVALYGLEHRVPENTIKALWNDGASLWRLAVQLGALHDRTAADLARPWIDRAVELGEQEARFARASMRAAAGDRQGALEDLRSYVAAEPLPPRLEEAQALRAGLQTGETQQSPEQVATLHLAADNPNEAKAALGGSCRPGLPLPNLLALGRVYEFTAEPALAIACYQQALNLASPEAQTSVYQRIGAASASLPLQAAQNLRATLQAASAHGGALAALTLARLAEADAHWDEAQSHLQLFLARAGLDEPHLDQARALQARVAKAQEGEQRQSHERARLVVLLLGVFALVPAILVAWRWSRTRTVGHALRAQPLVFPAISQAIGQIRHDVLKHRASSLDLLADPSTNQEDVARALLEPTPVSRQVAEIYQHLAKEALTLGLRLRPVEREPIFGPLLNDLTKVEDLLRRPSSSHIPQVRTLDQRLRGLHADRLQDLLRSGPRTLLDATLITRWIDSVMGQPGATAVTAPGLYLQEAQLAFPLPEATLAAVFGNILRNAGQVSPAGAPIEVRLESGRDPMGRRQVVLVVRDASPQPLQEADIDQRPSDRGLGIVRETVRRWGGQVFVRPESAPFSKAVGVRFPAPPEAKS
jgi:tetratricopeptide (TPR) repeat protein